MIEARPGEIFHHPVSDLPPGLVGTITYELYDIDGVAVIPETIVGVVEPRPGTYVFTGTAPSPVEETAYFGKFDPKDGSDPLEEAVHVTAVRTINVPLGGAVPSVPDIGERLHLRTITRGQNYVGTFTDETKPKENQVLGLIAKAYRHVTSKTGDPVPEKFQYDVRNMVEIYTAMLIELSYYPDQIREGRSPYPELKKLYDEGMIALLESLGAEGASAVDEVPAANAEPAYAFPAASIPDDFHQPTPTTETWVNGVVPNV